MAKLHISIPNKGEVTIDIVKQVTTIGRKPDNDVQIDDGSVSAHHAQILKNNGHYFVRDLDSTNKTCVNGSAIREALLNGSCLLRFGSIDSIFKDDFVESAASKGSDQLRDALKQVESLLRSRDALQEKVDEVTKQRDTAKRSSDNAAD